MNPADGWHESFLAEVTARLSRDDKQRLLREYSRVLAELIDCVLTTTETDEEDPPTRWSPWARGQDHCPDHAGHRQRVLRTRAKTARDNDDPLWQAWHALAESARQAEVVETIVSDPDGVS